MAAEFMSLHADERFRELFTDATSPVVVEMEALEQALLYDHRMSEQDRHYRQGRLAGLRAVQQLVAALHHRAGEEQARLAGNPRQEKPRAELRFLPRGLQGNANRAFPVRRRAAQGEP